MTVLDFKKKIEGTVSVESGRQRLIYCGKVLSDEKRLSEYDLNGKTVHLVLRAPHSTTTPQSGAQRPATAPLAPPAAFGGQWTIAWPPQGGQWPPIVIRAPPSQPGHPPPPGGHLYARPRSAAPSSASNAAPTTSAPTAPNPSGAAPSHPTTNQPLRPTATVHHSTMTIPIGQWTVGWPMAAPSWGSPIGAWAVPAGQRQRTTSGPASAGTTPTNTNPTSGTSNTNNPTNTNSPTVPASGAMGPGSTGQSGESVPNSGGTSNSNTGNTGATSNTGGTSVTGNSYLLGAFQVPQDIFDPGNLTQIVQDVMSQLGVLGRNATVMSRTSDDGSAVDVHINLGQIASNNEIRNRISVIRRLLRGLSQGLDQLDQSLAALDGTGPPIVPPVNAPFLSPVNAPLLSPVNAPLFPPSNVAGHSLTGQNPAPSTTQPMNQELPQAQSPLPMNETTSPLIRSEQPVAVAVQPVFQPAVPPSLPSTSSTGVETNGIISNKENKSLVTSVSRVTSEGKVASTESKQVTDPKVTSSGISVPKVSTTPSSDPEEFFDADESVPMASGSRNVPTSGLSSDPPLIGSESWHREVPSSWIPIISNDLDLQRRSGPTHEPLSEAYLNVLPKKKRKTGD